MDSTEVSQEIALVEERIEALTAEIARCGKIARGAKIAIGGGGAWFVLLLVHAVGFEPTLFVAALAALLGGVVLLGSNATTQAQTENSLRDAEAARAALIGGLDLRVVNESRPALH